MTDESEATRHRVAATTPGSLDKTSHSKSSKAATTNLLSLPRKIRQQIYEGVLRLYHPLYLFQEADRVGVFAPDKPSQWLALLFTSRAVVVEASEVLYGKNKFSLLDKTPQEAVLLRNFLHSIGIVNAGSLSHLGINLPTFVGHITHNTLREDGLQNLTLIRELCTSLKTVEFFIHSTNSMGLTRGGVASQSLYDALLQIQRLLEAMPNLERVLITSYDGVLVPEALETINTLGWIVHRP